MKTIINSNVWKLLGIMALLPLVVSCYEWPKGYEQILPRGRIVAITNPTFVSAGEAEIQPETWVLGVVINGQARAYSLNLLNFHEVVNDRIGETSFAAVW